MSKNEVKPVQVSVKEVRNYRRNPLRGGIVLACIALAEVGYGIWGIMMGQVYTPLTMWVIALWMFWCAFRLLRDYKKSAWMKAFWEDDWK